MVCTMDFKTFLKDTNGGIQSRWNNLIKNMLICQDLAGLQSFCPGGLSTVNPIVDHVLPSLLLIQYVTVFEEAAIQIFGKKDNLYNLIKGLAGDNKMGIFAQRPIK
jgi:hypothetical protein